MRVLMLYQDDMTGEAERGLLELGAHANFDWNAALFANASCKARFEASGKSTEIVATQGFDVLREGTVLRNVLRCAGKARGVVKRLTAMSQAADVVVMSGHGALAMAAGGLAGAIARRPVVWYVQDVLDEKRIGKWELRALRAVSKWLVSGVMCNSSASKKSFMALVGARSSHIEAIHPGVPADTFDHAARCSKAAARTTFGLPQEAYMLGCFDRLSSAKGQHVVLEALGKDADTHMVLLGEASPAEESYVAELKMKIQQRGLTERVHFVGRQADMALLMRAVDVVVNASTKAEAFDRHVVSGMLAGLPVIASRTGGNQEIVQHMKSGILVKPNDPEGLARSLQMLRSNPVFAEKLGKEAASRARARFVPGSCFQSMTSFIRRYAVAGRVRVGIVTAATQAGPAAVEQPLTVNAGTAE